MSFVAFHFSGLLDRFVNTMEYHGLPSVQLRAMYRSYRSSLRVAFSGSATPVALLAKGQQHQCIGELFRYYFNS